MNLKKIREGYLRGFEVRKVNEKSNYMTISRIKYNFKKTSNGKLERQVSGQQHWLLFQKTWV